ncbi:type VI secretion system Vgr family protein [Massilia niastensis]|uniref:type VI secretion system Vgr family protein n=1 Tax=Massilia niastensis TaxID=544911 RepID=UPI000380497E|nr:type VI secretion system Vgr family protein [Massilia niastensis]
MDTVLAIQLMKELAEFSSASRLYELKIGAEGRETAGLLVEAFVADEAVQEAGARDVIALSTSACLDLEALLGQPAALEVCLADGTRTRFAGEISAAAMLGSDGGLARYRIRITPWLWRLDQTRNSRVWQDKTVVEIVESVFASFLPAGSWRWSDETGSFLADVPPRSYCCQYRESDLDFVRRILAEEGLCWRFEQGDGGPCLVLFADSTQACAVPEDRSSAANGGIRYHGARSVEQQDTVQALVTQRRLHASLATVLSVDYKAKRIVGASSPSRFHSGSQLPVLESCDAPGQYAFADRAQAQRHADLQMQGMEARGQLWQGRSTVRTLCAGTRLGIVGAPLQRLGEAAAFTVLRVVSVGVNNMPPPARQALAELFGPLPDLLQRAAGAGLELPEDFGLAVEQARQTGYANCFEAVSVELPWRPQLAGSGGRLSPKPTAFGAQSAIVLGADGSDHPSGPDELYCDRLGRVRIRFHWQDSGAATCWVRVAQRSAGGGMGSQFLPRIGQEVLVQFMENDIDRPIVVGALYNGQGEGGIAPTPGGQRSAASEESPFDSAHDHAPSAQGNLAGGNSPVWHGASADSHGHRNAAAQWGIRSKEFGGSGYNQLVFDDTDGQGRIQLRSTHAATELNLGHLIHAADNYRGSFRGLGAELRTDAYGAVRAGAGLLVSSYGIRHNAAAREPAGENAPGIAVLEQGVKMAQTFHSAAVTHQTVGLAAHAGAAKANASVLDDGAPPLKAMLAAAKSMAKQNGSGEAAASDSEASGPVIAIAAKEGLAVNAAQSLQLANGETVTLMSGQDTQFVTGGQMRVQTRQAIGVLGGAVKAGEGNVGLQMIAAKDPVDIQAQADELKVQAKNEIKVISANAHIDWAAANSISLATAGGANIVIDGGNITVQCPGKIAVHAGKKSFAGAAKLSYPLPVMPTSLCVDCLKKARSSGSPFVMRSA